MALFDIWYRINKEIYFLTFSNFQDAPQCPGIYAWYYPFRRCYEDIHDVIREIQLVQSYDSKVHDISKAESEFKFKWLTYKTSIYREVNTFDKSQIDSLWNSINSDENKINAFDEIFMKCSIMMPPLYVGKTNNLKRRLHEHLNENTDKNSFHNRYKTFSEKNKLSVRNVDDLIFVCIENRNESISGNEKDIIQLIEKIMLNCAKPAFSEN